MAIYNFNGTEVYDGKARDLSGNLKLDALDRIVCGTIDNRNTIGLLHGIYRKEGAQLIIEAAVLESVGSFNLLRLNYDSLINRFRDEGKIIENLDGKVLQGTRHRTFEAVPYRALIDDWKDAILAYDETPASRLTLTLGFT